MAIGRKPQDVYFGNGSPDEFHRTPAPPAGERYVRDPEAARANAIRASVQAFKDSGQPVPEFLASQAAGLGEEMQDEVVLESLGRPIDPFAPSNVPVPPLEPTPIDWSGQGHLNSSDQSEAPIQSEPRAVPAAPPAQATPPGPVSAHARAADEASAPPPPTAEPVSDVPAPPPVEVVPAPKPTPQPTPKPAAVIEPEPIIESAPVEEATPVIKEPTPAPKPAPAPELKPASVVEEAKPEPAPAPQTVAAARKAAAAKRTSAKAAQRK